MVPLFLGIQLLVSISLSSAALKFYYREAVLPGISVQGVAIGGLSYRQAVEKLKQELPWPRPESLLVLLGPEGQRQNIRYSDINYSADYEASAKEALQYGQRVSSWRSLPLMFGTMTSGHDLPLKKKFNRQALHAILNELAAQYNQLAQDAQLAFNGDNVTVFQDIKGRQLDNEATIRELLNSPIDNHNLKLQFRIVEPTRKASDYKGINSRLAMYVTGFDPQKTDRTYNVSLASQLVNNIIVKPGEIFSLNKTLGPRTAEAGYRQAPVIVNNKLVPDYGGGVCQVATTLYNAVLLAGLKVVERTPHSMPVPYAPEGKDATIAGDVIDFKFLNNTAYPVLLTSQTQQGKLVMSVFGHRDGVSARLIKIETERSISKATRQYVEDPSLDPGQVVIRRPGSDGYELKTYEIVVENDQEISRRLIARNVVETEPEIIAVGPKKNSKGTVAK